MGAFVQLGAEVIAGRYRIVRWLGGGGMGSVYEALDTELDEAVALKILGSDLGADADAIERFRREVRLTRRVRHRNVARMFDIGEYSGRRFLTMELVEGGPLSRELGAAMPWSRLQVIARQICAGLGAAHAEGVIHRDLKPANVLVEDRTGRVVVTDFGIARSAGDIAVTQVGQVIGTPGYMAPEQLAGELADVRSDLFALGVMLFELATATRPWDGNTAAAIAVAYARQPRRPLRGGDYPPAFGAIIERCLALSPADRPVSAREVEDVIGRVSGPGELGEVGAQDARAVLPTEGEDATVREGRPAIRVPNLATPAPVTSTVSVMPFACADEDRYLADGMVEDLADALSLTSGLRVRPAGGSHRDADPRELGAQLGVDHVVSGSVRRTPQGLRIAARLVTVSDGFQVWAHRRDLSGADVLAVADELAIAVAAALSTRARPATRPKSTDPRAVELFLRARLERRGHWARHLEDASRLLEEATGLAPESPAIVGAFALCCAQAWAMQGTRNQWLRARAITERALALDHGDAHLASYVLESNSGDLEVAVGQLATTLAQSPLSPFAHEYAGRLLAEVEESGVEARSHFTTDAGFDPTRAPVAAVELARLDALAGQWESAWARLAPVAADPTPGVAQYAGLTEGRLHGWRRDHAGVLAVAARFPTFETKVPIFDLLHTSVRAGRFDTSAWEALLQGQLDPLRPRRATLLGMQILAELAALFDQEEPMFHALETAAAAGLADTVWLARCPLFAHAAPRRMLPIRDAVQARAGRVLAAFRASTRA